MPEQDERRTAPAQGEKREDVDDLIFRTAPSWPVSDRQTRPWALFDSGGGRIAQGFGGERKKIRMFFTKSP